MVISLAEFSLANCTLSISTMYHTLASELNSESYNLNSSFEMHPYNNTIVFDRQNDLIDNIKLMTNTTIASTKIRIKFNWV